MTTAGLWTITLSACVAVAGYLYKVWSERVRSRKLVLFYLLEIHHVLKIFPVKTEGLAEKYTEYCKDIYEKNGIPVTVESTQSVQNITPLMQDYFNDLDAAMRVTLDENLKISYEESLKSLAKDSPVLAYKLRGKLCLENMAAAVSAYSEQLNMLQEQLQYDFLRDIVGKQIEKTITQTFSEIQGVVNSDILKLAWGCGPWAIWNCWKIVNRKIEIDDDFSQHGLDEEFESYMAQVMEGVQEHLSKQEQSAQ